MEVQLKRLENPFLCPVCSEDRKKKSIKSASFNSQKMTGNCKHCGFSFVVYKEFDSSKEYKRPKEPNKTELSDRLIGFFKKRMISQDTVLALNITEQKEWMPQTQKEENCICFNYFKDGRIVNTKYRDGAKNFKLFSGAELIPYNLDSIKESDWCVWVEGEFDALAYYEAGIKNVLSVPNGATITHQNLTYLDNTIDRFENIKTFYLAGDNDDAGNALQSEMIRRFGAENCKRVSFKDCKDANEYLLKYGYEALRRTIDEAIDVPISGIYDIESSMDSIYSLWENGMAKGLETGHESIDKLITWVGGAVAFWTGIPSHGKSEWVDEVVMQLNVRYGWKTAYFSPENRPTPVFISKFVSRLSGKKFDKQHTRKYEVDQSCGYIKDNFFIIEPDDDDVTIENILSYAKILVRKKGIKQLVIDPWNKIDHQQERGETETQYISRVIDSIYSFAQKNDLLIHVIAHPTKMKKDASGAYEVPTLYDISGSAHFYNKAFYGISIYRRGEISEFHVQKVKFKHLGCTSGGVAEFRYNINNGRFADASDSMDVVWNNEPYLAYVIPEGETDQRTPEDRESLFNAEQKDTLPF